MVANGWVWGWGEYSNKNLNDVNILPVLLCLKYVLVSYESGLCLHTTQYKKMILLHSHFFSMYMLQTEDKIHLLLQIQRTIELLKNLHQSVWTLVVGPVSLWAHGHNTGFSLLIT